MVVLRSNLRARLSVATLQWSMLNVLHSLVFWGVFSHLIFCFVCFNDKLQTLQFTTKTKHTLQG